MKRAIDVGPFGELADPRVLAGLAARAEDRGWDGFSSGITSATAPVRAVADPWVALAAVACATSRVRIGALVTPLSRRRVHKVARETVTLDWLSSGRRTFDTVLYFQVTEPRAAAYEIASYLQAVEQLTVTTLRNVVGSMDLERTLTSRDTINSQLRGVLDDATGKWGLRVNRVEIKAIDPPMTIKDAMEKQMRAERARRAAILEAEGQRQSQILKTEGDKQATVLRAEGNRTAQVLEAEGKSRAIDQVFQAVHRNDPDPKLLAYQYLQTLPQLAQGSGSSLFVIPSEVTAALQGVSRAFTDALPQSSATRDDNPPGEPDQRAANDPALAATHHGASTSEPPVIDGNGSAGPASSRRH